jgi:hypothetical protein
MKDYDSYKLIASYTPYSHYAATKDGRFFLVREDNMEGDVEVREVADGQALENEALVILNEDCQPEVDGVYLPEEGLEKYFPDVKEIAELPGCFAGSRGEQQFIIVPRHIIEYDDLPEDDYFPFLFAHVFPPEEEREEMFALLRDMLSSEEG